MMLLTGDIGATTTRLALVSADAGPRKFVAEQEFRSVDFEGLQPIVKAFLASSRSCKSDGRATAVRLSLS